MADQNAAVLSHADANGRTVREGDIVAWGDRTCKVVMVHGPIPGSRATAQGRGTIYIRNAEWALHEGYFTVEADAVTVLASRTGQ